MNKEELKCCALSGTIECDFCRNNPDNKLRESERSLFPYWKLTEEYIKKDEEYIENTFERIKNIEKKV